MSTTRDGFMPVSLTQYSDESRRRLWSVPNHSPYAVALQLQQQASSLGEPSQPARFGLASSSIDERASYSASDSLAAAPIMPLRLVFSTNQNHDRWEFQTSKLTPKRFLMIRVGLILAKNFYQSSMIVLIYSHSAIVKSTAASARQCRINPDLGIV